MVEYVIGLKVPIEMPCKAVGVCNFWAKNSPGHPN